MHGNSKVFGSASIKCCSPNCAKQTRSISLAPSLIVPRYEPFWEGQNGAEPDRSRQKRDKTPHHHRSSGASPCGLCHGSEQERRDSVAALDRCNPIYRRQAG